MSRVVFDPSSEGQSVQPTKQVYGEGELDRVLRTKGIVSSAMPRNLGGKATLPEISFPSDCEINRVGQVATNVGITSDNTDTGIEQALKKLEEEREILKSPDCILEPDERSFLLQVNQLVAEMLHLLSQLSDRERNETDFSKKEYNNFNSQVAELTQRQGNWGAGVALGAFLLSGGTAALGDFWSKVGSALAGQAQPLSGWWTSGFAAESGKYSNKINLISTKLQNNMSAKGDNNAWRGELVQALSEAKECLKAAVRSNG